MSYGNVNPIFVVDDDQGILDSFEAMLGDDYPLVMINNVPDALELLGEYNLQICEDCEDVKKVKHVKIGEKGQVVKLC